MNSKKLFYLLVAVLMILPIGIGGLIYYSLGQLDKASNQVIAAKIDTSTAEQSKNAYAKNYRLYESNKVLAEKINNLLPTDKQEVTAIQSLYDNANEFELAVTSLDFPGSDLGQDDKAKKKNKTNIDITQVEPIEDIKELKNVYQIPLEVKVINLRVDDKGDPLAISTDQLLGFLNKIESNPRNMKVDNISYDRESEEVSLSVYTFIRSEKSE